MSYIITPYKQGLLDMMKEQKLSSFVTLTLNSSFYPQEHPEYRIKRAEKELKHFFNKVDRKFLGPRWSKKTIQQRSKYLGCVENEHSNIHYHLMCRIASMNEGPEQKVKILNELWVDSGDVKLVVANSNDELMQYGRYCVKKIYDEGQEHRLIIG